MTKDNGMDVSPSWQELKEERDALAAQRDEAVKIALEAQDSALEVLDERDALASHVERLQERARLITDRRQWEGDADPRVPHVLLDKLSDACMDAPATSLDRLKAEWQAEALELLLDLDYMNRHGYNPWPQYIGERASYLRRQSEDPNP